MADLIGQQLGQYKIIELLGLGGMAAVYKARQVSMGRDVALKVIEPTLTGSVEFTKRFEREMKATAMMSHPHILKVFDYGQQDGMVYLVMELLTGGSLADQISVGAMPLPQVTRLLEQMASALDYAHQKGVIHRDLKPQNVLLDESGNAFLTDFGIVKLVDETSALTQKGSVVGTPAYISPEHWLGQPVDYRADIYALGVVLFEMLTGQLPFQGETLYSMMKLHVNELPPSVLERRPGLPSKIEEVLARALAKNPAQRYGSAGDMAAAFKEAIAEPTAPAPAPASAPVRQSSPVTPRPSVSEKAPAPRQVDTGETSPMPAYRGSVPSGSTVHDTVPLAIPSPLPARSTAPQPAQRQPAKPPAAPAVQRPPVPLIVGGVVVIVALIVVVVLIASGGGGISAPEQTQTQAAILALTPSMTFTPSATVPLVAINSTNTRTPTRTPSITPTFTPTLTFTPSITPSLTDTPAPTLTPTFTATVTSTALPTQTPDAGATATAMVTATVRAITGNVNALIRSSARVSGPVSGTLSHDSGDAIVQQDAGVSLQDFVIDARFYNPYEATDQNAWDYGFLFRSEGTGKQYRLEVRSNSKWGLILREGTDVVVVAKGDLSTFDLTASGSNLLRLVVKGGEAYFYVNEQYVATMDVSAKVVAGDISIATGILQGDKIAEKVTRFENWAIAKIP